MIEWKNLLNTLIQWATGTGVKILVAVVLLYFSFKLINALARKIEKKSSHNRKIDKTLLNTFLYLGKILAKGLVVVCLVGYLGIDTSGLTALVTSLGVCVGLAVNGTLSNLAGGALLLITRPFKIDDYIEVAGYAGTVEDIRIVSTKLVTPDNKVVYIPNSTVSTSGIVNYSEKPIRRVDLVFSIAYSDDFKRAENIISSILETHENVLDDPKPTVRIISHSESSIDICCRPWVKKDDYWDVYFDITERVKQRFDESGIEIPFRQVDVHMKNEMTSEKQRELKKNREISSV